MYSDDNNDNEHPAEPGWLQALVRDLDRAETGLESDVALEHRLRSMRREVLQPAPSRQFSVWQQRYAVVAAVTVVALGLVIMNPLTEKNRLAADPPLTSTTTVPMAAGEDALLVMTAVEELKFYQELEFLQWLDQTNAPLG